VNLVILTKFYKVYVTIQTRFMIIFDLFTPFAYFHFNIS